jgi:D-sedoheptulose 7-phosphate isomerase
MTPEDLLKKKILILTSILEDLSSKQLSEFAEISRVVVSAVKSNKTIFWCGNGGSAAESSHLATELIGRFRNNRKPLPSISLNADTGAITCIANDFGYDEIFSRQLQGLAKSGDILIALSTSGQSKNILLALTKAKEIGATSVALLGKNGGEALRLADHSIVVESQETARIQEMHLLIGHTICEYIEMEMGWF